MVSFKRTLDIEEHTGATIENIVNVQGAALLLDELIQDMQDHPEASASFVATGETAKKLSAINTAIKSCVQDSQANLGFLQDVISELVELDKERNE